MNNSNKKKNEQLGESHGAATSRLRKLIMFDLLKQLNKNVCYRCNKPIIEVDDVSIDHKEPWLDSDDPVGKFFDLTNISFSHLSCNSSNARQTHKIVVPEGMIWCRRCRKFIPIADSIKDSGKSKYVRYICLKCHSKKTSSWHKKNNGSLSKH